MIIKALNLVRSALPDSVSKRAEPIFDKLEAIFGGSDKNAESQRVALFVFAIRVASAAIAFFSQVLLARWMGTFEYGIFVAVWAGVIILCSLTTLGFPSAVTRFVAEYKEQKRPALLWGAAHGSTWLAFLSSTVATTLGCVFLYLYPEAVTSYYLLPIFLAILCLPALGVEGVSDGIGRPFNWVYVTFLPTFIFRPLGILGVTGLAILMGYPPTATTAMWAALLTTYVTTISQYWFLFGKLGRAVEIKKPEFQLKYWMIVALPVFLIESFYVLLTQVDVIFVSWMMRPEDAAVYFAATKILALVHFVYFAVRAAVSHRYAAYNTAGNLDEYRAFVQKTVKWTFWPSLAIALVMGILGKYFLMLFGPEFVAGEGLLWILLAGIVIRSSVGPAEALLVMSGKQNACAFAYALALMINIGLNLTLIPMFGLAGAAWATALAMSFESLALYTVARTRLQIHAFIVPVNLFGQKSAGKNA